MFFYKKIYILKNKNYYINLFNKNLISWHKKNLVWQFLYSGFFFDDIFSKITKILFNKIFNISSFFVLDKWFSYWTGVGFFKQILSIFNKIFYFEKINYFFFLFILIISIPFFFFITYLYILIL